MQTDRDNLELTTIIVFSDSHRDTRRMIKVINEFKPNTVIHLGDHIDDARKVKAKFPDTTFHLIKGNSDFISHGDNELLLALGELKIFLTHGHEYYVKEDLSRLSHKAIELKVDLVLFGHTHKACIVDEKGITFMNPGQLEHHYNRRKASYGVVTLAKNNFSCEIIYLPED